VRRLRWLLFAALCVAAALVRLPLLGSQGLWADEAFSLAMATGHSLEHPAADADPSRGDFVEGTAPRAPAEWLRYVEHEPGSSSPARVLRAVLWSDTSPPLYYLLLGAWTRTLGTTDAALRGFSCACALLVLPLLLTIGRALGGWRAGFAGCALFAFSPTAMYYGTEGRHYALVWLFAAACAALGLTLRARGARPAAIAAWIAASAAGLLTHYFFAFVWLALVAWLAFSPRHLSRAALAAATLAVAVCVLPWYVHLPESLARWRITESWLGWEPGGFDRPRAAFFLFLRFFRGSGFWGGPRAADVLALVLLALALAVFVARSRGRAFAPRRRFAYAWLLAAWAGPLVFDALQGTYTVHTTRYALAGLPAACALGGLALSRVPRGASAAMLGAIVACWAPGARATYVAESRAGSPTLPVARWLDEHCDADELVLMHSIPSGLLSTVRYLERPHPVAAWVGQLGERRTPESLLDLARGRTDIAFVLLHQVGEPAPEEDWLRAHAIVVDEVAFETARIVRFRVRAGARSFSE
jgi:hypothetical protein